MMYWQDGANSADLSQKSYNPPLAPQLDEPEARAVAAFVSFRRAFHGTPFYTHRHLIDTLGGDGDGDSAGSRPADPVRRTYGQAQINARFGVKNRATLDPFLAVPMYSHRFVDETRTLPDMRARAAAAADDDSGCGGYIREFFPEELWATLEGKDAGGPKGGFLGARKDKEKEKRGTKRKSTAAHGADPFASDDDVDGHDGHNHSHLRKRRENETEEERKARIEAAIKNGENDDGENKEDVDLDDEEAEISQEDDDYDDDEGGDYDAEQYFDAGDNDEYGDDEGVGESAMDF